MMKTGKDLAMIMVKCVISHHCIITITIPNTKYTITKAKYRLGFSQNMVGYTIEQVGVGFANTHSKYQNTIPNTKCTIL